MGGNETSRKPAEVISTRRGDPSIKIPSSDHSSGSVNFSNDQQVVGVIGEFKGHRDEIGAIGKGYKSEIREVMRLRSLSEYIGESLSAELASIDTTDAQRSNRSGIKGKLSEVKDAFTGLNREREQKQERVRQLRDASDKLREGDFVPAMSYLELSLQREINGVFKVQTNLSVRHNVEKEKAINMNIELLSRYNPERASELRAALKKRLG